MTDQKVLKPLEYRSSKNEEHTNQRTHEFPPEEIRMVADLRKFIDNLNRPEIPFDYRIAVGGFLLDQHDKLVLIERGVDARDSIGKLEGIGGGVHDTEEDLHASLLRELKEEIGLSDKEVKIIRLLTIKTLPGKATGGNWVVPIYICKIQAGEPVIASIGEVKAIKRFSLDKLPKENLSEYEMVTIQAYLERKTQNSFDAAKTF